ncbi:hypothetical protein A3C89_04315 [Candidatus Kaiserbacteria bacterium RIFCSPHIGHO2_02_FULL_50_50]|uniref:Uncharacterized protein n=1 Tax=Candidatus Kaiserbacteria bacterium RIFCSPHIGHO2_02_FULL_50_50 TaxID=1798492 RepID=A0A1F6DEP0_9BACT|nr:MAG: hypothetical protein A3C89_04315 [Candidatus Kaiserbacteria bacterium RIFCSPHIGHO2_02_FULL_50_50]OGG88402.1 MAG: hypothetical protein A3G62_02265 [Candidatus Kaiserbacteria bacterium RIFCSPLOWO2_12_FULL_50_10]
MTATTLQTFLRALAVMSMLLALCAATFLGYYAVTHAQAIVHNKACAARYSGDSTQADASCNFEAASPNVPRFISALLQFTTYQTQENVQE